MLLRSHNYKHLFHSIKMWPQEKYCIFCTFIVSQEFSSHSVYLSQNSHTPFSHNFKPTESWSGLKFIALATVQRTRDPGIHVGEDWRKPSAPNTLEDQYHRNCSGTDKGTWKEIKMATGPQIPPDPNLMEHPWDMPVTSVNAMLWWEISCVTCPLQITKLIQESPGLWTDTNQVATEQATEPRTY